MSTDREEIREKDSLSGRGTNGEAVAESRQDTDETDSAYERAEWRRRFLRALRRDGAASHAAKRAGVSLPTVYRLRKSSPKFARAWKKALAEARQKKIDDAEAAMRRRGVEGWDQPVFQNGEQVGTVKKYSDKLLVEHLRAEHPRKYRPTKGGSNPVSVSIAIDARQAYLRDPEALRLACELDERLTLAARASEGAAPIADTRTPRILVDGDGDYQDTMPGSQDAR